MEDTICKDLICSSCGYPKIKCKEKCEKLTILVDIDMLKLSPQQALPVISISSPTSDLLSDSSAIKKDRFKKPLLSFQTQASGLLSSLTALLSVDKVYEDICQWADETDKLLEGKKQVTYEDGLLFESMIFVYFLAILDSSDKQHQQKLLVQVGSCLTHLINILRSDKRESGLTHAQHKSGEKRRANLGNISAE